MNINLLLPFVFIFLTGYNLSTNNKGFVPMYNGKNLDGWKVICRNGGEEEANKIFSPENNGVLHAFKNYPDGYQLNENKNDTHALMISTKKYSRYIFRFEYKWGTKHVNNFDMFQYDAGLYYHITEEKIWPKGIEYQVRYDHTKSENHTGDIWNGGAKFQWCEGPDKRYLPAAPGGVQRANGNGEHKCSANAKYNALNGKWNKCEIIVMADEYAIHKLNGKVVNMITDLSVKEGTIGLQAETAEIFYRNIMIKEFDVSVPASKFY